MNAPRSRPNRRWPGGGRSAAFLVAGLALLAFAHVLPTATPPGGAARSFAHGLPPGGSAGVTNATVNLTDAPSFDPADLVAGAGGVLHLTLANPGAYNHTFTLLATPNVVLPRNLTPGGLDAAVAANGTYADVAVGPGTTAFVNVSLPPSAAGGSFEFVSRVPYQFQAGMFGFLNVSGAPTGPGITADLATTDQFRFVPADLGVSPTAYPATVDVLVTNTGNQPHTFTLDPASNHTLTSATFTAYFAQHPPTANVNVPTGAGGTAWANFSVAGPGIYEFICEVPGHFANGMFGFLYVGLPPPANASAPSTELVQTGILVGAGSLLGVGLVIALAAAYTGRFPRAPPPGHP